MISQHSHMNFKTLESLLEILPEPDCVKVVFSVGADYSSVVKQAEGYLPGLKIKPAQGAFHKYELINPTKEQILELYKKSEEIQNQQLEYNRKPTLGLLVPNNFVSNAKQIVLPRIDLVYATFPGGDYGVKLKSSGIKIYWDGKNSDSISKVRTFAEENKISYKIKVVDED